MTDFKEGFPVSFVNPEDTCDSFDERQYCQLVEQDDPLNFAWDTEIIGETTEICFIAEEEPPCTFGVGAIPSAGTWKICFDLVWGASEPSGSVYVTAAGVVSETQFASPGEHCFYVTTLTGGDLVINNPGSSGYFYAYVSQICEDYIIQLRDLNGGLVDSFTDADFAGSEGIFIIDGVAHLKTTWSSLGLDDGCYTICVVQDCCGTGEEMILNGNFATSTIWSAGASWDIASYAGHNDGLVVGFLSQTVDLKSYTTYVLVFNYVSSIPGAEVAISAGGTSIGVVTGLTQFTNIVFTTGANPTDTLVFAGLAHGEFYVDNVSLKTMDVQCSPCYSLKEDHPCTKLLSWTNDDAAFGIPYYDISFTNYLRVIAFIEKPRYPQESDRFLYSNGQRKILYATSEKIWTLALDYLPQYLHDALALAKIHDHFYVDGIEYICIAGDYEPEWRGRNKAAQSKIEIQKVIDNNKNKNC